VVLCQQKCSGHMGKMYQGIPRQILPDGQNQRSSRKNLQFPKVSNESISEAWERLQEYILACSHHGMDDWQILQNFYNWLTPTACDHIDTAAGDAFFLLTLIGPKL
jgi:hypothetical protein